MSICFLKIFNIFSTNFAKKSTKETYIQAQKKHQIAKIANIADIFMKIKMKIFLKNFTKMT